MSERPLREVVIELREKNKQLLAIDDGISGYIVGIERWLREKRIERIASVKLPDGADLGWSRHHRSKRWRFVVRAGDDVWELQSCSREERAEVFACGAMGRLLEQLSG